MSTSLTLYDAQGILQDLMATRDLTKCAVCEDTLGTETYVICRFPDKVREGCKEHEGHTACKMCVEALDYVGEKGSCIACFNALGARRSSVQYAGVALRPAVRNTLANVMLTGFTAAEQSINSAHEAMCLHTSALVRGSGGSASSSS